MQLQQTNQQNSKHIV